MIKKRNLGVVLSIFLLTGCVEKEIIDDVLLVTGIGYDVAKEGKIEGTFLTPYYLPDQQVENNTFSTKGSPSRDLFRYIQHSSSDPVVGGSLEVVLYGKEFAEKGIYQTLDALQRDPGVGSRAYFAVVDGNAKDVLKGKYGKSGNASYISDLIKHNSENRDIPKTNMHLFLSDYYRAGKSAYLPMLKLKGKKQIIISGLAFFENDKMVYSIPEHQLFYFKLLAEKYSEGTVKVKVGKEEAAVGSLRSKFKRKLVKRNPHELNIEIEVQGLLHQYTGKKMNKKVMEKIKKSLETQIETTCTSLSKEFQDRKLDPLGYGHFVKTKTRNFNNQEWLRSHYQDMKITVNATVTLLETGVIE